MTTSASPARQALLALAATALAVTAPLHAQDDRNRTTPTETQWLVGKTGLELQALTVQGWRIVDFEVEQTSPATFCATLVRNTGTYQKSSWFYPALTGQQVTNMLNQNSARLTDIERYEVNGVETFAAQMIANTGADGAGWWWYYGVTAAQMQSLAQTNNARIIDFDRYLVSGAERYAVVMVYNVGAHYASWQFVYNQPLGTIQTTAAATNARIYDLGHRSTTAYDAVLISDPNDDYTRTVTTTSYADVVAQQRIHGTRVVDFETFVGAFNIRFYDIVLLDNLAPEAREAANLFETTSDGAYGVHLEQLNGATLASLNADATFDPAGAIATLPHARSMRELSFGNITMNSLITIPQTTVGTCANYSTSAPWTFHNAAWNVMRWKSDRHTMGMIDHFGGLAAMNADAQTLGMTSTQLNRYPGCPGTANTTTLRDLARLYLACDTGWVGTARADFYDMMVSGTAYPGEVTSLLLHQLIAAEATALNVPDQVRDAFSSMLTIYWRRGDEQVNGLYDVSDAGIVSMPFQTQNGGVEYRTYAFGAFNVGATDHWAAQDGVSRANLAVIGARVREALASWGRHAPGFVQTLGRGCVGSTGAPFHTASNGPEIGQSTAFRVQHAPPVVNTVFTIGFSSVQWQGASLPYDLTPLNAPGCKVTAAIVTTYAQTSDSNGNATWTIGLPPNPAFIAGKFYTQVVVFDPAANGLGLTITNGLAATVGGSL